MDGDVIFLELELVAEGVGDEVDVDDLDDQGASDDSEDLETEMMMRCM